MISAPTINGMGPAHAHSHARSIGRTGPGSHHHRLPDKERLRMDAQKFLVPSLPVGCRSGNNTGDLNGAKRSRERSIVNGTSLPPPDPNNNYSHRSGPYAYNRQAVAVSQLKGSPQVRREEAVHPYNDRAYSHRLHAKPPKAHHAHPAHFQAPRSSMPIPCSSPAPATSASPKASSPSTHNGGFGSGPQLPNGMGDLRLYPGYPHHPSMALQSNHNHTAAFYAAAAAAAAASHPLPYPLFGSPFPLSHAAASSYLDKFHSNFLAQQQQLKKGVAAAASPSPPSRYYAHEPVANGEGRYGAHLNGTMDHYHGYPICSGLSQGGPLGIGPIDMGPRHPPPPVKRKEPAPAKPVYSVHNCGGGSMSQSWAPYASPIVTVRSSQREVKEDFGRDCRRRAGSPESPGPSSAMVQRILNTNFFNFQQGGPLTPPPSRNGHGLKGYEPAEMGLDLNTKTAPHYPNNHNPFLSPSPKKASSPLDFAKYLSHLPKPSTAGASASTTTTSSLNLRPSPLPVPPPAHAAPSRFTFTPPKVEPRPIAPTVPITPVSKRLMPELVSFRRGSSIELAGGERVKIEELSAEDLVHSAERDGGVEILRCTLMAVEGLDPTGPGQHTHCRLILRKESKDNQQISIQVTPEQPFFVEGRGWASVSPRASQALLQLPCTRLEVGDVCLTLTRANPPRVPASPALLSANLRSQGEVPLSPSSPSGPKSKSYSILSCSKAGSAKAKGRKVNGLAGPKGHINKAIRPTKPAASLAMLPPPIPIPPISLLKPSVTAVTSPEATAKASYFMHSPKKRRWSAPPPETSSEEEAEQNGPSAHKKT